MIDLRAARADPDAFRAALARRGAGELFDSLLAADARWRDASTRRDDVRAEQKRLGKPSTPEEIEEARRLKGELQALDAELAAAERERQEVWDRIPNLPHESVPEGEEEDAVELRRAGEPPGDAPREHTEIGRFDMERAARVSGSRFGYWIGDTALLALALYRFALDRLVAQGFVPVLPPVLVREQALYGTGWLPSADPNSYKLEGEDLYLAGTAEIPIGGLHADEIIEADALPLRYVGFSPCFRSEAGAAGKDTSGMFRVHQFNKVEQFVFTRPEDSWDEHELLLANTEGLVAGARRSLPRRRPAHGGHVEGVGEDVRRRAVVPVARPLPRDGVDHERDRLPGAPLRHALPRRAATSSTSTCSTAPPSSTGWRSRSSRTSRATCQTCCSLSAHPSGLRRRKDLRRVAGRASESPVGRHQRNCQATRPARRMRRRMHVRFIREVARSRSSRCERRVATIFGISPEIFERPESALGLTAHRATQVA